MSTNTSAHFRLDLCTGIDWNSSPSKHLPAAGRATMIWPVNYVCLNIIVPLYTGGRRIIVTCHLVNYITVSFAVNNLPPNCIVTYSICGTLLFMRKTKYPTGNCVILNAADAKQDILLAYAGEYILPPLAVNYSSFLVTVMLWWWNASASKWTHNDYWRVLSPENTSFPEIHS